MSSGFFSPFSRTRTRASPVAGLLACITLCKSAMRINADTSEMCGCGSSGSVKKNIPPRSLTHISAPTSASPPRGPLEQVGPYAAVSPSTDLSIVIVDLVPVSRKQRSVAWWRTTNSFMAPFMLLWLMSARQRISCAFSSGPGPGGTSLGDSWRASPTLASKFWEESNLLEERASIPDDRRSLSRGRGRIGALASSKSGSERASERLRPRRSLDRSSSSNENPEAATESRSPG
mmetsp:Transcript_15203/g.51231  ORF Transcript_15203/g.51231 Transcript_15203/m.51231 type:complete len:233 (+) Transcript_15203:458-1156(+)